MLYMYTYSRLTQPHGNYSNTCKGQHDYMYMYIVTMVTHVQEQHSYMYMVATVTHVKEQHSYMYMVTMVTYVPMTSPATVCSCAPHPWTSHGLSDKSHRTSSSLPGSPSLRPHPL